MSKFAHAQNNFSSGELSPKLDGRNDLKEYPNGVKQFENMRPLLGGGGTRRGGSEMIVDLSAAGFTNNVNRIPFKDMVLILGGTVGNTAKAVLYSKDGTATTVTVLSRTASQVGGSSYSTTLYREEGYDYDQVGDILILTAYTTGTGYGAPPLILIPDPVNAGQYNLDSFLNRAYNAFGLSLATGIVRANPFQLVSEVDRFAITTTAADNIESATDLSDVLYIGALVRVEISSTLSNIYQIDSYTAGSPNRWNCTLLVGTAASVVVDTQSWALNSWNMFNGWPRTVAIFNSRAGFGGCRAEQDIIWESHVDNLYLWLNSKLLQDSTTDVSTIAYFGAITDADAFDIKIDTGKVNDIKWMSSGKQLQVGTADTENNVQGIDGIFGPLNAFVDKQTNHGSSGKNVTRIDDRPIFISKDGRSLRDLFYSRERNGYISSRLSILSDEIYKHLANQNQSPPGKPLLSLIKFDEIHYHDATGTVWMVAWGSNYDTKALIGVTIDNSTGTLAWHKHTMGATANGDNTVTGVCVSGNETYITRKMTINAAEKITLERIHNQYDGDRLFGYSFDLNDSAHEDMQIYLDSSIFSHILPSTQPTAQEVPVAHLGGETVAVVVNGIRQADAVVQTDKTPNYITLADPADTVNTPIIQIGLTYKSIIESMKIQQGSRIGNPQVQFKSVERLLVNLYNSLMFKIGRRGTNLETVDLTDSTDTTALQTVEKEIRLDSTPDTDERFYIETEEPFPLTVLSVGIQGVTQD